MDFSREWTDLGRIANLIEELRRISPEARLNYYKKLRRKEDLFFVSWAGHFFMDWFAADLDGKHNKNSWLLISRDVKTIQRIITDGRYCDRRDWERIYKKLYSEKEYIFNTRLGYEFLRQLYLYLNPHKEAKINNTKTVPRHPLTFSKRMSRFFMTVFLIICIGSLSIWAYLRIDEYRNKEQLKAIHSDRSGASEISKNDEETVEFSADSLTGDGSENEGEASDASTEKEVEADPSMPPVLSEYEEALSQNSQLYGWISSDGLGIDLPVTRPVEESDFYLHHDFTGAASDHGCLFVDASCSIYPRSNYIVIYGHNMRDNTMFGKIDFFADPAYLASHRDISFDTIYEKGGYEAVATLRTRLLNENEDGFRYYRINSIRSEKVWNDFIDFARENICAGSLSDLKYGDDILLLSTCEYTQDNGRLVVVCHKV